MDRINHPTATAERTFTGGNPAADIQATVVTPEFMTGLQEELCNVIEGAGIVLDPEDNAQLDQAIDAKIAASAKWDGVATAGAGGTVDAITADFSPAITVLKDRQVVTVTAAGANTSTTPTFAPNGLAAHPITKAGGQALAAGNIPRVGFVAVLQYDLAHTRWELLNPVEAAVTVTLEQHLMYS